MLTLQQALQQGSKLLEDGAIAAPRLTAEVLLCHALGEQRPYLYAHATDPLTEVAWIHYGRYLHQRLEGRPTQYITRTQEFYGRPFRVSPDVLIPRPETEHVIETALARVADLPAGAPARAVDVGCGSGAIGVTWQLETGMATFATDISAPAIGVARGNAANLGAGVGFAVCDLAAALAPASFPLILSNPPYIPEPEGPHLQREVRDWEPHVALFGGPTGVEIYVRLIAEAARVLVPGGRLVMEIGYQARDRVLAMLGDTLWREAEVVHDLAGWPRVIAAWRR
ncbi:MAG: peptide chain release factor N(5)-glutamine methyltransferase [Bryobacteraceae bacterium]